MATTIKKNPSILLHPKRAAALILGLLIALSTFAQEPSKAYEGLVKAKMDRTEWFRDARFGMFIHYGPYAIAARGEWVKSNERMTTEQYQKYVDAFVPQNYNPEEWAALAKNAGMKYAVMTAKHHDGFCMFDSKHTDYKITHNLPGRDFIKEYIEAFRKEGLKIGLYYSLIDWYHEDYPYVGNHPQRDNPEKRKVNWDNYLNYMHKQVEELMTRYGKIDILWLDYSFGDYHGEKWKARELVKMIRKHQPDIILNSRLNVSKNTSKNGRDFGGYGDFETPEQAIPESGVTDVYRRPIPWETCLTLNNNWGYRARDNEWKSPEVIIRSLVEVVSKDGNLLLNIGPDPHGNIPIQSREILTEVGTWMAKNSESIYGCGSATFPQPSWGYFTQKDRVVYAHWINPKVGYINIQELSGKVDQVQILSTGERAATAEKWWGNEDKGNFFINIKEPIWHTYSLPDELNTVLKIRLK